VKESWLKWRKNAVAQRNSAWRKRAAMKNRRIWLEPAKTAFAGGEFEFREGKGVEEGKMGRFR